MGKDFEAVKAIVDEIGIEHVYVILRIIEDDAHRDQYSFWLGSEGVESE